MGGSLVLFTLGMLGCSVTHYKYVYKDVEATFVKKLSSFESLEMGNMDTSSFANAYMALRLEMQVLAYNSTKGLVPNATASKGENTYSNTELLKDIKVVALNNYNGNISAGDDVSEQCFYSSFVSKGSIDIDQNKEDIIAEFNGVKNNNWTHLPGNLNVRLGEPPTSRSIQQFAIEIRLGENSVLCDTTVAFVLKP